MINHKLLLVKKYIKVIETGQRRQRISMVVKMIRLKLNIRKLMINHNLLIVKIHIKVIETRQRMKTKLML